MIITMLVGFLAVAYILDWLKQVLVLVAMISVTMMLVTMMLVLVAVRIWDLTCITILV